MISDRSLITPDWPAPANVRAVCTTRMGGVSQAPWDSMNLGSHVGDDSQHVQENRQRLAALAGIELCNVGWLDQVHGTNVVSLPVTGVPRADASHTGQPGCACVIMTADCLPVLLCDVSGTRVGAAHAGWRSLCGGVLEELVSGMGGNPAELMAWLGPAIGPQQFEVGAEVRDAFLLYDPAAADAFSERGARAGHYMADIYLLARQRLAASGVSQVYGGDRCTVSEPQTFFSYRRDGQTGRMASMIWLSDNP
ncbi:peptidoglycan editing factor PgeF [Marinobacter sp. NP-4(2019)]|uniref:peptidoglycan editing factor PgeF n=1 Tax=Marinobacter sp. NP-4(2019) TaxID=2488665 RepID=UPI000FC3EA6A|nr:peptidoglycan editing factor PgeF [Marinobacter sp. NP-4(2019)]AZT82898.1 peptidoglycan editing factor PgeF [Marinobacter sp. NP-4(2019)]